MNDGATVVPEDIKQQMNNQDTCEVAGKKGPHKWIWEWVQGVWTNQHRCMTCGKLEENGK